MDDLKNSMLASLPFTIRPSHPGLDFYDASTQGEAPCATIRPSLPGLGVKKSLKIV